MVEQLRIYMVLLGLLTAISSFLKWTKETKGQRLSPGQIIGAVSKILILSLVIVALIFLPMIDQPRIENAVILPTGVFLVVLGVILNVFAARQLTRIKFHMRGLGTPDRLITAGLFSTIRHPSSLGIVSIMIGWYLAWGARYCIYFVTPIIVVGIFVENKLEERNLARVFGDEYRVYKKKVGMYFPRIWKGR